MNYVILATKLVSIQGSTIGSFRSGDIDGFAMGSFVGSYGQLKNSYVRPEADKGFSWAYPSYDFHRNEQALLSLYGAIPPPVPALPLKAAQATSVDAVSLGEIYQANLALPPGDYVTANLWTHDLRITRPGRVRIFIANDRLSKGAAFLASGSGAVNAQSNDVTARDLEIWYGGEGTIRLDNRCRFAGIIYAPNARIELAEGVRFRGAIVGRDVIADKNTVLQYDESLVNWTPEK